MTGRVSIARASTAKRIPLPIVNFLDGVAAFGGTGGVVLGGELSSGAGDGTVLVTGEEGTVSRGISLMCINVWVSGVFATVSGLEESGVGKVLASGELDITVSEARSVGFTSCGVGMGVSGEATGGVDVGRGETSGCVGCTGSVFTVG